MLTAIPANSVDCEQAAASLCVASGSFHDPDDIPGFSHFLEHMLFMGSKKYKKENAFDDFISKHGGDSNAWTDAERTVFFFDIHKDQFAKALDIFAQFFISPLFNKTSVDREIMAVDNEFGMILSDDNNRYHQLLGYMAFAGSPISRFLCGNKKTLKLIPEEKGIDVYGRLRDFHKRNYSAHYMTLVLQAPETLDDLQDLVCDLFENIPNNKLDPVPLEQHRDPFVPRNFHKLMKVVPNEDCKKLDICWPLPPLQHRYRVKPLDYISVLVTHEGPGSILALLRKRGWAVSLTGGNFGTGFDFNKLWSGFFVSVFLTDSGMEHTKDVVKVVFEYINMLQKCGPQAWFYSELRDIEKMKFRFREESDPIDNVEQLSENMQLYPLQHYLIGRALLLCYDDQLIRECLTYLTPSQSSITLWSKAFDKQGICDQICPWFTTRYCLSEIPTSWKQEWQENQANPDLYFPEKNRFIPTDFDILKIDNATEHPIQVLDNKFGRIWYKKDRKFKLPKGFIMLHLMTPAVANSVINATLCDLLIAILQQHLQEALYTAQLIGYEFSLECLPTGIVIHSEGFTDKLPQVLEKIVLQLASFSTTQNLFDNVKTQLKQCYYNEMLRTYDFAKMLRFSVMEREEASIPARYRVCSSLTLDMLTAFHKQFMDRLYVEGLVTGNFTPQHAMDVGEFVQKKLCKKPLAEQDLPVRRLMKLPTGDRTCRVRGVNPNDTNSCVTSYYQLGPGTIRDAMTTELITERMKEPLFNKLRTEQQIGYSVQCSNLVTNGILGFSISIETHATKFGMSETEESITTFLHEFQKTISKMTKPNFTKLVNSVVLSKQVEDTQLGDETGRYWHEILERCYVFNRQEKELDMLQAITLQDLKAWFQKLLSSNRRHISFQVEGSKLHPIDVDSYTKAHEDIKTNNTNFLRLLTEGDSFIEDLEKFRDCLELYPVSKVV